LNLISPKGVEFAKCVRANYWGLKVGRRFMKRIAIVDDHKLFSAGLQLLLSDLSEPVEIEVFDQPKTFLSEIYAAGCCHDLVTLDYYIPGYLASQIIGELKRKFPGTRVLVVSASVSPADRKQALASGADAFLHKHAAPELLLKNIGALLQGGRAIECGEPLSQIASTIDLTPRQLDTLLLASKGMSNKEIARMLEISPETVKSHLSDIYLRFSVGSRLEAIEYARSKGLC
jgi:DNA-binding NarL/FixJ family response regulator